MLSKTFTDDKGVEKTVFAEDQEALDKAISDLKDMPTNTYPNINVPVKKGHDLIDVDEALNVNMVDGTGAHNSPRDAVRDDGSLEGQDEVASPGAGEAPLKEAGTGKPVGEPTVQEPSEKSDSVDKPSESDAVETAPVTQPEQANSQPDQPLQEAHVVPPADEPTSEDVENA